MRILHLCLASIYVDKYNYQENALPKINKEDGHDVSIIASTEAYIDNVHIGYVNPSRYQTEYGVPIIRIPYRRIFSRFVSAKLRKYKGLYEEISGIDPDIIYMHDICFGSVRDVVRFKKQKPNVRLYADTHTAYYNSGRNWFSMIFLHRGYYRYQIKKILPYLEKYYYIGDNEKRFSLEVYGVSHEIMEFLPLGGFIPSEHDYKTSRKTVRDELGISDGELLFLHSGKLTKSKKTESLLDAFYSVLDINAKLAIIGSMDEEVEGTLKKKIERDKRVMYLGWKNGDDLMKHLCACDLYCQPGSASSTLQNAICGSCPIMAYPLQTYKDLDYGNFVWVTEQKDMQDVFRQIGDGTISLETLRERSIHCAEELLDYRKLAARYY